MLQESNRPSHDGDYILSLPELLQIIDALPEYMSVHSPVFDESGRIVDCLLVVWNAAYAQVRTRGVKHLQSMRESYYEPDSAFRHVNEAWQKGRSHQLFELNSSTRDAYRHAGEIVRTEIEWQRAGQYIVEIGRDLSEFTKLQMELTVQQAETLAAENAAALAEERERIARDLHDSVIQRLFTLSLSFQNADLTGLPDGTRERVAGLASTIDDIIRQIRDEIFDVRRSDRSRLTERVQNLLHSVSEAANVRTELVADDVELQEIVQTNLIAVVREALSNAIRHGRATHVTVSITCDMDIVVVQVDDNGTGLPDGYAPVGGTHNMMMRAELLGGTMSLVNHGDAPGARLTWRVPTSNVALRK